MIDTLASNPGQIQLKPVPLPLTSTTAANGGVAFGNTSAIAPGSEATPAMSGGAFVGSMITQAIATGGTIAHLNCHIVRLTAAAGSTGVILAVGAFNGQELLLINTSANAITPAVAATSFIANGAVALATLTTARLVWSQADSLWYRTP